MGRTSNLLGQAADFFKGRETAIQTWLKDDGGRYAFVVNVPGSDGYKTPMVVCAKQYLFTRDGEPHASFMKRKVVERASDMNAKVLLFVGDSNQRLVFDPDVVLEAGKPADKSSKRAQKGEPWLEVPSSWGCSLMDFADRRDSPRSSPPDDVTQSKPTGTLQDYV